MKKQSQMNRPQKAKNARRQPQSLSQPQVVLTLAEPPKQRSDSGLCQLIDNLSARRRLTICPNYNQYQEVVRHCPQANGIPESDNISNIAGADLPKAKALRFVIGHQRN